MSKDTLVNKVLKDNLFELSESIRMLLYTDDEGNLIDNVVDAKQQLAELAHKLYVLDLIEADVVEELTTCINRGILGVQQ